MEGPGRANWPFPFSIFRSLKIFYFAFAALMAAALIVPTVCTRVVQDSADQSIEIVTQTVAPSPTETAEPTATETPSPTSTPDGSPTPAPTVQQWDSAPAMTIDAEKKYFATIKTDKGDIRVELDAGAAPQTVNSFVFLAREGFYDGVTFHRVIPGFVAQAGDPTGRGDGGPGYTIPDEPNELLHDAGVIAMAKTSNPLTGEPVPNSAGSQFYLAMAPQHHLDGLYTVFGRIVDGQDVLAALTPRDPAQGGELPPGDVIVAVVIEEG